VIRFRKFLRHKVLGAIKNSLQTRDESVYELHSAKKLDDLARDASKVAAILRRAARLAELLPNQQYKCELGTIVIKLEDVLDKATRLNRDVEKEEKRIEAEKEAAKTMREEDKAAKRKKGA
jgi:hypothetical protein